MGVVVLWVDVQHSEEDSTSIDKDNMVDDNMREVEVRVAAGA
jgi:hypothetical protein